MPAATTCAGGNSGRPGGVFGPGTRHFLGFAQFAVVVFAALATLTVADSTHAAQQAGRTAYLVLWFSYGADGTFRADFDGWAVPPQGERPDLSTWGLTPGLEPRDRNDGSWHVHGTMPSTRLSTPEADGFRHLRMGPLRLGPADAVTFYLPFVHIDYAHVLPPPYNQELLQASAASPHSDPSTIGLQYVGGEGQAFELDIPIAPPRREIALTLTPLLGEMLTGVSTSFRLSGRVVFDEVRDFAEFARYCAMNADPTQPRYRDSALLWALDAPPFRPWVLSLVPELKSTFLELGTQIVSCEFNGTAGRIEATFAGRAYPRRVETLPPHWSGLDLPESNQKLSSSSVPTHQLTLGRILLGPGDLLTLATPGMQIRSVEPPPTTLRHTADGRAEITYEGPRSFELKLVYAPEAALLINQFPATVRTLADPAGSKLREAALLINQFSKTGRIPTDPAEAKLAESEVWLRSAILAALAAVLSAGVARSRLRRRWQFTLGGLAWGLAGLLLLYGVRGTYGLLALAVLAWARATGASGLSVRQWIRGLVGLTLVVCAVCGDWQTEQLFTRLGDFESTPFTPLLFLTVGLGLAALLVLPRRQRSLVFPGANLVVTLGLTALCIFDVVQKSLVAFLIIGLGLAYVAWRAPRHKNAMGCAAIVRRFRSTWRGRFVPIGWTILVIFAAAHGLRSTSAVPAWDLGILGQLVLPALVVVSIVEAYLAIGTLFIFLHPVLPFRAGYIKALSLAAFLTAVFIFGLASDSRFEGRFQDLIVGRLVYYASVPLLIGLYLDIAAFVRNRRRIQVAEGAAPETITFRSLAPQYFKEVRSLLSTAGAIAGLVVPTLYAATERQPLVTTYFDLIEKILSLSTA